MKHHNDTAVMAARELQCMAACAYSEVLFDMVRTDTPRRRESWEQAQIVSAALYRAARELLGVDAALASKQADSRTQHDIDSAELRRLCAELRRLCAERDEMRRANSLQEVEVAGLESSVGHLGALVDELRSRLADALRAMKALHESATPEDTEAMNAIIPAAAFRQFVDDHAALLYAVKNSAHDGLLPAPSPAAQAQAVSPEAVMCHLYALNSEAKRRGGMFPQTSDETDADSDAIHRVCDMVKWYGEQGYPKASAVAELQAARARNMVLASATQKDQSTSNAAGSTA